MTSETEVPAIVVRDMDGKEVSRIPVHAATARKVETVMRGLLRNMDTDRFYADDSAFDGLFS